MDAPRPRPAAPYAKASRLRIDKDFTAVRTRSRRYAGREASIRSVENGLGRARLGLATPKKYGGAVRRNRFRRLAREAFRALAPRLPGRDLLVEPRRDLVEPTLEGLQRDLALACGTPIT
jgi:ribonuclease P protein component